MKKSNFLIVLLLCLPLFSNAQNDECLLINDTFCFITLDIRGNNKNPIIMNGLLNKNAI